MALKALILRNKIEKKTKELESLRAKSEEFEKRETELKTAIEEAETEEEQKTVEEEVEKFEKEKSENDESMKTVSAEIDQLEADLRAEEEKQNTETDSQPEERTDKKEKEKKTAMVTREFYGMNMQERTTFFARNDVKEFVQRVRDLGMQKRAVTGAELTIPEVVLPLIYSEVEKTSKLISKVNLVTVRGTSRQTVMGDVPEAVWTEMCKTLNEVGLTFTGIEIDGYKVGAFIPVCNAVLEDNDVNLASEIISALGQGIAYALDKAIVYGTGTKMPTGAFNAAEKVNASGKTGANLFKTILSGMKNFKHAAGELTWIMSEGTKYRLMAEALTINAAGAIVSGVNSVMPIIGGEIVTEDFVPEGEICVGYMKRYILGQRSDIKVAQSSEVRFIEDQTVFKATARYDGKPVFQEAFEVIGLDGAPTGAVDTDHAFAADKANQGE